VSARRAGPAAITFEPTKPPICIAGGRRIRRQSSQQTTLSRSSSFPNPAFLFRPETTPPSQEGPAVRIRLPPAKSLRTIGSSQGLTRLPRRQRQRGLLDQPNDLQLLGGGVSHTPSSPAPIVLFFSSRFSSVSSATTSLSALASRRSSLTSSEVAARAVSPARRFLPASRNSFDQR
jgi:hypothetical protein